MMTPLQLLHDPILEQHGVALWLKRDDLIHPLVSGNKFRKLKYNLQNAQQQGYDTLLTFGGAYSNHIYATAAAGKIWNFKTIGIIRGDELNPCSSKTLQFAASSGMQLIFVSRTAYRDKESLREKYGQDAYYLPEGGTNHLAIQGVAEVVAEVEKQLNKPPDYFVVPVGTGGTMAGVVTGVGKQSKILGVVVLKNAYSIQENIIQLLPSSKVDSYDYQLLWNYHTGGYAQTTPLLYQFIQWFETQHQIPIEQVYTGKMLMALYDLIEKEYFAKGTTIVAIHTGGLQGRRVE